VRNYPRSITIRDCRTPHKKREKVWKNLQIDVGVCARKVRNVEDEATQRIIHEEAERLLVAAYINGLAGLVGQQVRFRMPHTLEEAVTVSNAERVRAQEPKRVFSTKRDSSSQGVICCNCGKKGHYARLCRSPRRD